MDKRLFTITGNQFKAREMIKRGAELVECVYNKNQDKLEFRFEWNDRTLSTWEIVKKL